MANPGPASTVTNHPQNVTTNQAIRLLGVAQGVNLNATGDTVIPVINSTNYSVANVILVNGSISLTTAQAGLFTGAGAGGTAVVANALLNAVTGPTVVSQRTVASTATNTGQYLYWNVSVAQGAAATGDVYIYGYDFS